ncbi:MAG: hypothetical protein KAU52_00060 [Methanosarcinales archaeon]|nr:hypothetical protein [Methanosarcinales archaeon]
MQSSPMMAELGAYGCGISPDIHLSNDYIHNDYKNNHPHPIGDTPMKFHNHGDELQELHPLRNAPSAMIILTGLRRVGKTDVGTTRSEIAPCM